jgi:hypothetical protein
MTEQREQRETDMLLSPTVLDLLQGPRTLWGPWRLERESATLVLQAYDGLPDARVRLADVKTADKARATIERVGQLLPRGAGHVLGQLAQAIVDLVDPFKAHSPALNDVERGRLQGCV